MTLHEEPSLQSGDEGYFASHSDSESRSTRIETRENPHPEETCEEALDTTEPAEAASRQSEGEADDEREAGKKKRGRRARGGGMGERQVTVTSTENQSIHPVVAGSSREPALSEMFRSQSQLELSQAQRPPAESLSDEDPTEVSPGHGVQVSGIAQEHKPIGFSSYSGNFAEAMLSANLLTTRARESDSADASQPRGSPLLPSPPRLPRSVYLGRSELVDIRRGRSVRIPLAAPTHRPELRREPGTSVDISASTDTAQEDENGEDRAWDTAASPQHLRGRRNDPEPLGAQPAGSETEDILGIFEMDDMPQRQALSRSIMHVSLPPTRPQVLPEQPATPRPSEPMSSPICSRQRQYFQPLSPHSRRHGTQLPAPRPQRLGWRSIGNLDEFFNVLDGTVDSDEFGEYNEPAIESHPSAYQILHRRLLRIQSSQIAADVETLSTAATLLPASESEDDENVSTAETLPPHYADARRPFAPVVSPEPEVQVDAPMSYRPARHHHLRQLPTSYDPLEHDPDDQSGMYPASPTISAVENLRRIAERERMDRTRGVFRPGHRRHGPRLGDAGPSIHRRGVGLASRGSGSALARPGSTIYNHSSGISPDPGSLGEPGPTICNPTPALSPRSGSRPGEPGSAIREPSPVSTPQPPVVDALGAFGEFWGRIEYEAAEEAALRRCLRILGQSRGAAEEEDEE